MVVPTDTQAQLADPFVINESANVEFDVNTENSEQPISTDSSTEPSLKKEQTEVEHTTVVVRNLKNLMRQQLKNQKNLYQ